jgi:branched-chain amino acid transport system ATP-binding protein
MGEWHAPEHLAVLDCCFEACLAYASVEVTHAPGATVAKVTALPTPLLSVAQIAVDFGGVKALQDVSLSVQAGEVLGIIGPNGAGKTTLFSVISGFLRPTRGRMSFLGKPIEASAPHERCRMGMVRTWQIPRAFSTMTVRENVLVSAVAHSSGVKHARSRTDAIICELGLEDWVDDSASDLPPGQRKRLELARALVTEPKLLLLDEVMAGQTAAEADALFAVLQSRVREQGLSILMIEHVIRAVRSLCGRVVVLANGTILSEGEPAEVMRQPEVMKAYLGAHGGDLTGSSYQSGDASEQIRVAT